VLALNLLKRNFAIEFRIKGNRDFTESTLRVWAEDAEAVTWPVGERGRADKCDLGINDVDGLARQVLQALLNLPKLHSLQNLASHP
jgi:hypothetical protein